MKPSGEKESFGKLLEAVSLSVVLKARLDAKELEPYLEQLLAIAPTKEARRQIQSMQRLLIEQPGKAAAEVFTEFSGILEDLKESKVARQGTAYATTSGPAVVETLSYNLETPKEVLESFQAEATAHLQSVEQKLLQLESNPNEHKAMDAIFGAMHSLKGVCGFLGLASAQELAHESESVIDRARKREDGLRRDECDGLLRVVDVLAVIVDLVMLHAKEPASPLPKAPESYYAVREELLSLAANAGERKTAPKAVSAEQPGKSAATAGKRESVRSVTSALVRVQVEKLDSLIDTIGELVVTQSQIHQDPQVRGIDSPRLFRNLSQLNKITRELQSVAMSLRMYPLRETFARMTRIARDLARQEQKEIEVAVRGADTEMDKNLIESMIDPLTHLIRNAVDHGVDTPAQREKVGKPRCARIQISARHQGGNVIIEVSDDGRGLDLDRILAKTRANGLVAEDARLTDAQIRSMIFEPGLSTAEKITELSGRGVGLDVVRKNVQALGGRVAVTSTPGQGTTFELIMPLTLAIIDGLIVRVGQESFIVPITSVLEALRPARKQVSTVQGRGELVEVRGAHLPIVRLAEFAGVESDIREPWNAIVMIVECDGERCGMMVDDLLGQQQVVIKSLGDRFRSIRGVSGGAILGDGRVGLILDVSEVLAVSRKTDLAQEPFVSADAN